MAESDKYENVLSMGYRLQGGKHEYVIEDILGRGGFGITYAAWDSLLQKKVAIKEYLPNEFAARISGETTVRATSRDHARTFVNGMTSFLEESRKLAKFNTVPGIVRIFDCFSENNTAYIVMEYLDGKNLKQMIEERGKISYDEAVYVILQVLKALEPVHQAGLIHRDIAPDNIFVCSDGQVKLIDFGVARFVTTSHSRSLSVMLKLGYAPVEQYSEDGNQGTWTDVYACGATLYHAITGVVPPHSYDRTDQNKSDKLIRPRKLVKKLPKNVETAILNAMNVMPENRTQTAEAFADELENLIDVKRVREKLKHEDTGRISGWLKFNTAAAAVVMVVLLGLIAAGVGTAAVIKSRDAVPEGMTRVPNVTNGNPEYAEKTLDKSNLKMIISNRVFDDYYSEYEGQHYGEERAAFNEEKLTLQEIPLPSAIALHLCLFLDRRQ